jgi:hypothetical protein
VNAERTEGESGADLAESDACVCAGVPLGVGALFVVRDERLFTGVDDCDGKVSCGDAATVGDEEVATAPGDKSMDAGAAA